MKIAAITMVYRDYWALSQWYDHYGRHLGHENLYVIAHGADPQLNALCPKASILTVPRDRLDGFDQIRSQLMNHLRSTLLTLFDWVIQTDADELVCLDPDRYGSFADLFAGQRAPALFALGLNVAEGAADTGLDQGSPALPHRPCAVFTGHYSKAWAASGPVSFARHGLALGPRKLQRRPMVLPRGVYLAHLKYACIDALDAANQTRRDVTSNPAKGLPGTAWRKPDQTARNFFIKFERLEERPWDEAEAEAFDRIATDPVRDTAKGVLRARSVRFGTRTRIPDRIRHF